MHPSGEDMKQSTSPTVTSTSVINGTVETDYRRAVIVYFLSLFFFKATFLTTRGGNFVVPLEFHWTQNVQLHWTVQI